jgi:hypothetical protein
VRLLHPRGLQLGIPPDSACFLVLNRTLLNRTLPEGVPLIRQIGRGLTDLDYDIVGLG